MVRGKILQDQEIVREFDFEPKKVAFKRKVRETKYNITRLI